MTYIEQGIEMQTTTAGGTWKGVKRVLTGAGFLITTFFNQGKTRTYFAFAAPYLGQIITLKFNGIRRINFLSI